MDENFSGMASGEESETKKIVKRLKNAMTGVYPRLGAEIVPDSPEYHADVLFKILNELRQSRQMFQWPLSGSEQRIDKMEEKAEDGQLREISRQLYLVRQDKDHRPVLSPEKITLPEYPRPFVEAVENFIAGKPWEEIKEQMAKDPDLQDRELEVALKTNIDEIRDLKDVGNVAALIDQSSIVNPQIKDELSRRLGRRLEHQLENIAKEYRSLAEVQTLQDDVQIFFRGSQGRLLGGNAMIMAIDTIDAAAVDIASRMLDEAKSPEEIEQAVQQITEHPFSMGEMQSGPLLQQAEIAKIKVKNIPQTKLLEMSDDLKAKLGFIRSMQRRHSKKEAGLDNLQAEVEKYNFKDKEIGERYREELIALIDRKRRAYKNIWAENGA